MKHHILLSLSLLLPASQVYPMWLFRPKPQASTWRQHVQAAIHNHARGHLTGPSVLTIANSLAQPLKTALTSIRDSLKNNIKSGLITAAAYTPTTGLSRWLGWNNRVQQLETGEPTRQEQVITSQDQQTQQVHTVVPLQATLYSHNIFTLVGLTAAGTLAYVAWRAWGAPAEAGQAPLALAHDQAATFTMPDLQSEDNQAVLINRPELNEDNFGLDFNHDAIPYLTLSDQAAMQALPEAQPTQQQVLSHETQDRVKQAINTVALQMAFKQAINNVVMQESFKEAINNTVQAILPVEAPKKTHRSLLELFITAVSTHANANKLVNYALDNPTYILENARLWQSLTEHQKQLTIKLIKQYRLRLFKQLTEQDIRPEQWAAFSNNTLELLAHVAAGDTAPASLLDDRAFMQSLSSCQTKKVHKLINAYYAEHEAA